MDFLQQHIEALIFCAAEPITTDEIVACLTEMFDTPIPMEDVENTIQKIITKYKKDDFVFQVRATGGGWQFLTKPAYQVSIGILLKHKSKKKLSTAALETLAIVAYKQPITRSEIEKIRGVNCDYALNKLLEKELVEIVGKADTVGKPVLYGTTRKFMDYFGINHLGELPQPKQVLPEQINEIGNTEEDESETE